jgi:hypothetical protein
MLSMSSLFLTVFTALLPVFRSSINRCEGEMNPAMSVKQTVHKSSESAKSFRSKRLSKTGVNVNAVRQIFLDSFETVMFNANSSLQVTVSPYSSLSLEEFGNDPLLDDTHLCIMNVPRKDKTLNTSKARKRLTIPAAKHRRVHFASELEEVHFVTYPSKISKQRRWYQRVDYQAFKQDVRATIMAIYRAQGLLHQLDMKKFTVSGLEKSLSLQQVLARKRNGAVHVQAVLWQQAYGKDPIHIRQISELFTKSSMQRAHFRGVLDSELLGTFDKSESGIDFLEACPDPEYF